jgi:5,10-methylenetetrahydromethanopterin reductase
VEPPESHTGQSSLRWGVGMWQTYPAAKFVDVVKLCEAAGYDEFWYGNHKLYRDMFMGLMLAACHSQRMRLGSFVAEPYTMHPALIAAAAATLDEASGGRALLGLGAGGANFKELGVERSQPLAAMEETIRIARGMLRGETVTLRGRVFTAAAARLQFEPHPEVPIVLATRGTQMLRLGGRLADGVMIATYAQPAGVRYALQQVEAGAHAAGRRLEDLTITSRVDACVWPDGGTARDAVKPMIAGFLMASYPDRRFVEQMGLAVPEELEAVVSQKNEARTAAAWRLVPDDFVDAFTWAGTPDEVARRVAAIVDLGITRICYLPQPPPGQGVEPIMRAWIEEVVPRVRRLVGA